MNPENFKQNWNKNGFFIVRKLLGLSEVEGLKLICDRILNQWIIQSKNPEKTANLTNMAFLTEPRYFSEYPQQLTRLLNLISSDKILDILENIFDFPLLFHNTQYFFNPANRTRPGDWHRDQQFDAKTEEIERLRMQNTVGIHVHIAFLPDNNLEYIPGSQCRWDSPEELNIRKGLNGKPKNSEDIPNSTRIHLDVGDAVFFNAWGIHRGNYIAEIPRRTFDIIYGTIPDWYTPPPTCFLQENIFAELTPRQQLFFQRFIESYKNQWSSRLG
ncbi:MAG: phytanoyl-CoA dioxygenase family protein [Lyngbya sp.]|nr:phytanoyl-CoA dioxygenase family protein [Lyngbya sp.]